ncbi:MAG: DUF5995 family protein [Gemmatimonadota bacterium]
MSLSNSDTPAIAPALTPASTPAFTPARTISEVVERLDDIIARAMRERDRLGYFAAMYRAVTVAVQGGIAAGRFEDGPRMERLDVVFANRYLEALDTFRRGGALTASWRAAFDAASSRRVVILQHLLLGMNAHINLDLGIAAAEVCPGPGIVHLERDFNAINSVLAELETDVEREVCSLSPWIDRLAHIDPRVGRVVANFSMEKARACSWLTALRLAAISGAERADAIRDVDADVALLSRLIERPVGYVINVNLLLVRLREAWDPRKVTAVLAGMSTE